MRIHCFFFPRTKRREKRRGDYPGLPPRRRRRRRLYSGISKMGRVSLREKRRRRETRACVRKKGMWWKARPCLEAVSKRAKAHKRGENRNCTVRKDFSPPPLSTSSRSNRRSPGGKSRRRHRRGGILLFFVVVVGGWKGDEKEESFFPLLSPSAAAVVGLLAMEDPSKVEEEKRVEEEEGHQTTFSLLSVRGDAAAASSP